MANEINIVLIETALTLVAKVWNANTQVGSDISMTENTNRLGHYYGDSPASIADGEYTIIIETDGGIVKGSLSATFQNNSIQEGKGETRIRDDETAQGGDYFNVQLNENASSTSNLYINATIVLISGTGAGQRRKLTSYNGSNKKAAVDYQWTTPPDNTTVYRLLV